MLARIFAVIFLALAIGCQTPQEPPVKQRDNRVVYNALFDECYFAIKSGHRAEVEQAKAVLLAGEYDKDALEKIAGTVSQNCAYIVQSGHADELTLESAVCDALARVGVGL